MLSCAKKYDYVIGLAEIGNGYILKSYKRILSNYINYDQFILLNPNMEIESNIPFIKYINIFLAERKYWKRNPRMVLVRLTQLLTNKDFFLPKDVTKVKGTI